MSDAAVADLAERRAALDPARSFIVQAPAGSGKTELLIQRYLVLLSRVRQPEEIAAITFTIKAAAEMRARVLAALAQARTGPRPEEPHRALTWDSARAVLARDAELGWRLEEHAERMRIQTMDALCASLTGQMPLLARFGANPETIEDASDLYREAARATLALLSEPGVPASHVARLLEHLDNNLPLAEERIAAMLAKRDQWLRRHGVPDRGALEAALAEVQRDAVERVRALWPPEGGTPPVHGEGFDAWLDLCDQLLTKRGTWLKASALAQSLAEHDELCAALHALRKMPPASYTDAQWEVLAAIAHLLPIAVAQLKLVFAARGQADFTEIAQGALLALGESDAPTDLMLALDYRIQHILVDEFQDTSITQYKLIESLTAGWQSGDDRTLFLVGDPMQSIYRFREAEVGLFLRARREGIGAVALNPLTLHVNFRSQAGIVAWVNRSFARILPEREDYAAGAVSYTPTHAVHPPEDEAVRVHPFFDEEGVDEAARVVDLVRQARGDGSIAILVRARNHLEHIVPALKRAGVRYRAIEIETLDRRQPVQDLLALTRALAHPGDRVAWLALLRAPCCGLTLADLHALCGPAPNAPAQPARARGAQLDLFSPGGVDPSAPPEKPNYPDERTLWEALHDERRLARLSAEGRARLVRVLPVLERAMAQRARGTLRERIEAVWLSLGGPVGVGDETDLEDAETFLDYLGEREQAGDIADPAAFEAGIAKLYALPDLGSDGSVQIMTIHNAKGLEFDTVIVPGLGKAPPQSEPSLLLWTERATPAASTPGPEVSSLLLAPIKEAGAERDPIYSYLVGLNRERESHEDARLLYVAVTRAKKRLHIVGSVKLPDAEKRTKAASRSLLEKLWPAVEVDFARAAGATAPEVEPRKRSANIDQDLRRLPLGWTLPPLAASTQWNTTAERADERDGIEFSWAGETARRIGSVAHRWLQRIATDEMRGWDRARLQAMSAQFRRQLAARGVAEDDLEKAAARVHAALANALADPRGRWLLGPQRDARNEYRLTATVDGIRREVIVDRTFVDAQGRRWIVDYKTSSHEGADVEGFLDRERERYSAQLALYARILSQEAKPRLGLYFPLVSGWREWE
jgi:ATP-dependent exoDNAse (exonuclease V) beta subunit